MNTTIADDWYENFFEGINCEMWEKAATKEWTDAEVAFLIDEFNVPMGSHLLDIPCGIGRHSLALARQGFNVTSVDISETFLTNLRSKVAEEQLPVEVVQGNIITLPLTGSFDGAICLGNSFGYFLYPDMKAFIQKVAAVLKPGAKWIINTGVLAESFLRNFEAEKKYELEGLTMAIHNDYDVWNSCLLTTLTYTKDDRQEVHHFKHFVYTVAELIRLLAEHQFKTIALYSSTNKTPYMLGDAQVYLVAEKI